MLRLVRDEETTEFEDLETAEGGADPRGVTMPSPPTAPSLTKLPSPRNRTTLPRIRRISPRWILACSKHCC